MIIIAGFIHPFILYPKRREIWKMRNDVKKKWFFKYADTSETEFGSDEKNFLNSFYGIYELVKKRDASGNWVADYETFETFGKFKLWILSFRWQVIRNGAWNYIAGNKPTTGKWINYTIKGFSGDLTAKDWRDKETFGFQFINWEIEGDPKKERFFRYSFTKKFLFGYYINFMLGTSVKEDGRDDDDRHLIKFRIFKIEDN